MRLKLNSKQKSAKWIFIQKMILMPTKKCSLYPQQKLKSLLRKTLKRELLNQMRMRYLKKTQLLKKCKNLIIILKHRVLILSWKSKKLIKTLRKLLEWEKFKSKLKKLMKMVLQILRLCWLMKNMKMTFQVQKKQHKNQLKCKNQELPKLKEP